MATTQLADVYEPTIWARTAQEAQTRMNGFLASGVAVNDSIITQRLSGGSSTLELPQFQGITEGEPNYSNDDPSDTSTPDKIGSQVQKARSASRNKSWSSMSLARELTDADPVGAINQSIGHYWATDDESRLLNSMIGIKADNVANDAGDMVYSVATDDAGAVTDAERIGGESTIRALQTLGDKKNGITAIAMHSVQHARLQIQGLLTDNFDPETGALRFQTYLGKRVIVDDSLPQVAGTNRITYTVVLFGAGAVGYGTGPVLTPSELERKASSGNGGGEDIIHSRVNTCFHPYGFEFTSATIAAGSTFPTYANLQLAANWNRVVARKNVNIAFLEVND